METAESTPQAQEPDSLEEPGQEPGESEVAPTVEESATGEEPRAVGEADAVGEPDPVDTGVAEGEAAAEESTDEPSRPAEPSPSGEPFSFRVDGQEVEVDEATISEGKITLTREAWDKAVQPRLHDHDRRKAIESRMQNRVRQLETEATAREERFKKVLGKVDELFSDPERIRAFAERYETEAPRFKLEVENELLKTRTQQHEETTKTQQQQAEEREFNALVKPSLQTAVDTMVDRVAKDAKVDRDKIVTELEGLWESGVPIFFRVQEGDGSGLDPREHKWGVDMARVEKLATPYIQLHRKTAAEKAAEKAEKANAEALGKNEKPKAPPTAPAGGSPTPGGKDKYPTTREEYEEYKKRRSEEVGLPL